MSIFPIYLKFDCIYNIFLHANIYYKSLEFPKRIEPKTIKQSDTMNILVRAEIPYQIFVFGTFWIFTIISFYFFPHSHATLMANIVPPSPELTLYTNRGI